jgi:hypothetical protein
VILKASQRSGARSLAAHLLNARDNDVVEVHDIRGVSTDADLTRAFVEMDAQARGTRSTKPLFSVSFNPPVQGDASIRDFEAAFAKVEEQFGLEHQPRAVVFHEKEGRRHAHVVWSLIDLERGKALEVKFFKNRLRDLSRALYLEQGWKLPDGLKQERREKSHDKEREHEDFTLADQQRAKRAGLSPEAFRKLVKETFERSDSRQALAAAFAEHGLYLAKGGRGFCLVDTAGDVHALARASGYKKREVETRLGSPDGLPSVEQVQQVIERRKMRERFERTMGELRTQHAKERNLLKARHADLLAKHAQQQDQLRRRHWRRQMEEERARAGRLQGGVTRLFDRLTKLKDRLLGREEGTPKAIAKEREESRRRDLRERDDLRKQHRLERREFRREHVELKARQQEEQGQLRKDLMQEFARNEEHREAIRNAGREREGPEHAGEERDEERTEEKTARRPRGNRKVEREQANDNTRATERGPELGLTLER